MTDETDPKRLRLVKALDGLTPKKSTVTPKPARSGDTTNVRILGNGNVVGDGNIINNHGMQPPPRIVVNTEPGASHITDEQAAALQKLHREVVDLSTALRKNPVTPGGLWKALNEAMKVPSYRLIPLAKFERAKAWLVRQRAILRSMKSAPKKVAGNRASSIGAIHARVREFDGGLARRKAYMLKNFGTDTMTECSDEQIEQIRKHVFGWKR